jgi:hypothetical protein
MIMMIGLSPVEVHTVHERGRQNTGAIAGGTIGGFFAVLFLLVLVGLIAVVTVLKLKGKSSAVRPDYERNVSVPKMDAPKSIPPVGGLQNDLYGSPDE